jgi:glycosyltransferase involved in cell wall biosynthesis
MKCLALSNSYPPDHVGGYELGACNILESLAAHAGWQITVVASIRNQKSLRTDSLELTGFFPGKLGPEVERWKTKRALLKNHSAIVKELQERVSEADIVFIFNPRRLIFPQWTSVLNAGKPAFVFVSDHWPQDPLASDIFYSKSPKTADGRWLRDEKLRALYDGSSIGSEVFKYFKGVLFGSRFLQNEQRQVFAGNPNQTVTHWGINTELFPQVAFSNERLKTFGFCGRPEKEKGLQLALNSIRDLAQEDEEIRLLVASDLEASAFGRSIRKQIHSDPILKKHVTLLGQVPHSELHEKLYRQIGVLLFPSIWQEPFALTVLEAMASGALLIGSTTGGTPEVVDEKTGYLFNPELDGDLTRVCLSALKSAGENKDRVEAGARRIREKYSLPHMANQVDSFVRGLV